MAYLAAQGRGFAEDDARVPIVPGAALFDLTHGGDKAWGRRSPYGDLGYAAAAAPGETFALGTAGAGFGAWTYDLKGGLGSASAITSRGFLVGALVAVNAAGRVDARLGPAFLGRVLRARRRIRRPRRRPTAPDDAFTLALASDDRRQYDARGRRHRRAPSTRREMTRIAIMASGGFALGAAPRLRPGRRRHRVRRLDRRARAQPPTLRDLDRNRRARRRMRRPGDRARRLRGAHAQREPAQAELAREDSGPGRTASAEPLGTKRRGSMNGVSPVIISASSRPLTGPSVRPRCWWPKSNHRPLWRGAGPMTGSMSGRHGRRPSQGFGVAPLGEREEFARERLQPVEMGGRGRIVAAREFGAGRQAQAARHRRDHIAVLEIEHRPAQPGVAARRVMHVIAALDEERQAIARRRSRSFARPGPQRDDHLARRQRPVLGGRRPSRRPTARACARRPSARARRAATNRSA